MNNCSQPDAADESTAQTAETVIGRAEALARLGRLIAPARSDPHMVSVHGELGVGKTALLDAVTSLALERGATVLRARGSADERDLAFAGLHQLLRTALPGADRLPDRQRACLLRVFGIEDDPAPVDRFLLCLATLALLVDHADGGPLLLVVDDAHEMDRSSLDVLTFIGRRIEGEPIALIVAARGGNPMGPADHVEELHLEPLDPAAAQALLDAQPLPPTGEARRRVLDQAAGNPLALIELTKSAALGHYQDSAAGTLLLTDRLESLFAPLLDKLPDDSRRVLLCAAASGTTDLTALPAAANDLAAWRSVEEAGLVRLRAGRIHFRHPLVGAAVYQAAPPRRRRDVHLALAAVPACPADRRAWHLSAAALAPDEDVAQALESTADRALQRQAHVEALAAMERAAELTPDGAAKAGRYVRAVHVAMLASGTARAVELASRLSALTDDPVVLAQASILEGWAASTANRHHDAVALLAPIAMSMSHTAPEVAHLALAVGAGAAYHSGHPSDREHIIGLRRRMSTHSEDLRPFDLLTRAATEAHTLDAPVLTALREAAERSDHGHLGTLCLGTAALILDEPHLAVRLLGRLSDPPSGDAGARPPNEVATMLGWAQFQLGRWTAAEETTSSACGDVRDGEAQLSDAWVLALSATLAALRGETAAARNRAGRALALAETQGVRSVAVWARRAAGAAAAAEGNHDEAYRSFRLLFTEEGAPIHHHASDYGLAELATAAVRTGRTDEAREILSLAEDRLAGAASTRLRLVTLRAGALLADPADPSTAESAFRAVLDDPANERWPFELAQTRLEYGEWLRRRRRIGEARPCLAQALEVFERLGSRPWTERARAELRASGLGALPADGGRLSQLTAQQREIVGLAAQGMTNRQIGNRLFLSPRTVGFHLYQVFPKLGITARSQLRGLLEGETAGAA
ncbi:AAA family ATPase [Streptomyces sp. NPDC002588]|uniref:helix-turn-helix transcriptional regulator n=1 Tax=Streptomyces sp. NPDC002588 TaxID=3154419 RepID=UPI003328E3DE